MMTNLDHPNSRAMSTNASVWYLSGELICKRMYNIHTALMTQSIHQCFIDGVTLPKENKGDYKLQDSAFCEIGERKK